MRLKIVTSLCLQPRHLPAGFAREQSLENTFSLVAASLSFVIHCLLTVCLVFQLFLSAAQRKYVESSEFSLKMQ